MWGRRAGVAVGDEVAVGGGGGSPAVGGRIGPRTIRFPKETSGQRGVSLAGLGRALGLGGALSFRPTSSSRPIAAASLCQNRQHTPLLIPA